MAKIKLTRAFSFGDKYYEPGIVDIPGFEEAAEAAGFSVEDFLPKGATIVTENVTLFPKVHPTVSTLSEMAKIPASAAVTASHGPTAIISDAAMAGKPESEEPKAKK